MFGSWRKMQRDLRALRFEQKADGYLFFRSDRSHGIPVSPAEREAYLSAADTLERHIWRRSVAGRQPGAKRRDRHIRRRTLQAIPLGYVLPLGALMSLNLIRGITEQSGLLRILSIATLVLWLCYAVVTAIAHALPRPPMPTADA